jgi:molybdopterin/thiamine biosynthesis adenylyltransferase
MDPGIDFGKYTRHLMINGFHAEEQEKLRNGKVLVVGAGGLGSPVLMYLTGAGVGQVGIVENDSISVSNLPRQIIYNIADIGKKKAQKAFDKMKSMNNDCEIFIYEEWWTEKNAFLLAKKYDIIIDCTDNHVSRYLTDEVSRAFNIPFVYGAIHDFEGQVAVFNYRKSKSYADVFPKKDQPKSKPVGVIGPLAGVIGSLQAAEAMKILTGFGAVLSDKMLFISLKHNRYQIMDL